MGDALQGPELSETIEEVAAAQLANFESAEEHAVVATAEAVLNADPRRLSSASQARSARLVTAVANSFPQLDPSDRQRVAALLRCLGSVQTWLRMREEFGISGGESGPVVVWAMETLIAEIRKGNLPDAD